MFKLAGDKTSRKERLIIETTVRPIKLKTSENREGGRVSNGPEEGLIASNNLVMSSKDPERKAFKVALI